MRVTEYSETPFSMRYIQEGRREKTAGRPVPEASIKAYIGPLKEEITEQVAWPETVRCPKCKARAELMMVVEDSKGEIAGRRSREKKIWPHDSMAIAHYFCSNCGEMVAHWNQA